MPSDFILCDVFAERPGQGNQLCVFPEADDLDPAFFQRAAHEINFSETTFMLAPERSEDDLTLRIFTPARELPFAGHPIVGSAVVAAIRRMTSGRDNFVRFATKVGQISVEVELLGDRHAVAEMRQPIPRLVRVTTDGPGIEGIASALGVTPAQLRVDRSPIAMLDNGIAVLIVPLDSLATAHGLRPNPVAIAQLCERVGATTMAAVTTETESADTHLHCRIFAPGAGVWEDPATGSANGPLGVYAVEHGLVHETTVVSEQGIEMGRPSRLTITVGRDGAGMVDDVRVAGSVFVVGEGRFFPW